MNIAGILCPLTQKRSAAISTDAPPQPAQRVPYINRVSKLAQALRRHEEEDDFYEAFDPLYF